MNNVLTLIGPTAGALGDDTVSAVRNALETAGAALGDVDWLSPGEACEFHLGGIEPAQAEQVVRDAASAQPIDVAAQATSGRRKKLLVADMDSTMVVGETLDDLAAFVGLKDEVAALTARGMAGELDFNESIKARVAMLKDLPEETLEAAWQQVRLMSGAETLVRTMATHGAHTVLVTGGFTYFSSRVAERVGFHEHHANDFVIADGRLTGEVAMPIVNRDAKLRTLRESAAAAAIGLEDALAVGDGANDLDMVQAAGLGVAYRAKPVLAKAAPHRVDHGDLTALLYFQGYRREEFAP